jgi:hypothetical protein
VYLVVQLLRVNLEWHAVSRVRRRHRAASPERARRGAAAMGDSWAKSTGAAVTDTRQATAFMVGKDLGGPWNHGESQRSVVREARTPPS